MDPTDKLNLQKMINANDVADCTEDIRLKRHSGPIRRDIKCMVETKRVFTRLQATNPKEFEDKLIGECRFLFDNYTDIFNKVLKDEIDLNILYRLLDVLEKIETGELDQHSGAYEVGKLLKELYIDSALKKAKKLDEAHKEDNPVKKEPKKISWKQYAAMQTPKAP